MNAFRAAAIQTCCGTSVTDNLAQVTDLIRQAKIGGADFVATPENTGFMAPDRPTKLAIARHEEEDIVLAALRALAAELKIWLSIGSLAIKINTDMTANRSFVIDSQGNIVARYDKIHLFDVDLPDESYRESDTVAGGNQAITADLPWGRLGLSICYDIRFARLYRTLAQRGAFAFAIPAAFTATTGAAHWHVLTRARAIENGAFVLAAAQCGVHPGERRTFGHSMIVSPWGKILAEAGDAPGVVMADIAPVLSAESRKRIPSLKHDREYS